MAKSKKLIPHYPAELKQKLVDAVRAGQSPEELAEEHGPSAQSIRNWVAKASHTQATSDDVAELKSEVLRLRKVADHMSRQVGELRRMLANEWLMDEREIAASPFEELRAHTD